MALGLAFLHFFAMTGGVGGSMTLEFFLFTRELNAFPSTVGLSLFFGFPAETEFKFTRVFFFDFAPAREDLRLSAFYRA